MGNGFVCRLQASRRGQAGSTSLLVASEHATLHQLQQPPSGRDKKIKYIIDFNVQNYFLEIVCNVVKQLPAPPEHSVKAMIFHGFFFCGSLNMPFRIGCLLRDPEPLQAPDRETVSKNISPVCFPVLPHPGLPLDKQVQVIASSPPPARFLSPLSINAQNAARSRRQSSPVSPGEPARASRGRKEPRRILGVFATPRTQARRPLVQPCFQRLPGLRTAAPFRPVGDAATKIMRTPAGGLGRAPAPAPGQHNMQYNQQVMH